MKKLILVPVLSLILFSCTENYRTRTFGGEMTVELPKGERLLEATWKESALFYLTEPMDSDYIPKTKIFREKSNFGYIESTIKFVERR